MTNLDRAVTLLLIGKVPDGIESVPALGRRFLHHPQNTNIVVPVLIVGSVEILRQAWVKLFTQKCALLVAILIAGGITISKSEIV